MNIIGIILAAGQGKRMNADKNKQFLMVNSKPILYYTLTAFLTNKRISKIILVVNPLEKHEMEELIVRYFNDEKDCIRVIEGGKERYNSVFHGLEYVKEEADYVLIHDGARPLVSQKEINQSINYVTEFGSCIIGVKAKNTYKQVDKKGFVNNTVERECLYSILTPQCFPYEVIYNAYENGIKNPAGITDDSMMVELYGEERVKIIEGSYDNIKITTPDDLKTMEKILEERNTVGE